MEKIKLPISLNNFIPAVLGDDVFNVLFNEIRANIDNNISEMSILISSGFFIAYGLENINN